MPERSPRPDPERDVVDPDVDLHDPGQRADTGRREAITVGVIAIGGVLGAEARYGISVASPHASGTWPWSTLVTNIAGCLLIGVLMVVVERRSPHHLVRPLLGVGVLGGFTTFSTFALDDQRLLVAARPGLALAYIAASLAGCLAATALAISLSHRLVARARP